ncbi:hypothetical protein [Aeromonas sp. FDAARGOS 1406]|uniref:hypothetical protein n=1 Tax=Aeromonas sp. FDAARGOS 1406 TaxID=2778055 RepID=UPI001C246DD3|nr:hypothetical protein [Aeromonas sp. FDAARGOS 1406]QXB93867.1 hypothetical protein I6L36_13275 [Aeromonas sp. FDAARGOS 1406]
MENFKHLPEPFRIRVIEPVKRTTRAYREEAIVRAGMNPFLLDSEAGIQIISATLMDEWREVANC